MLIDFFLALKHGGLPVSLTEHMDLLATMEHGHADMSVEQFYYLSRMALVKRETDYDRFDRVFAAYFKGLEKLPVDPETLIPDEWLRRNGARYLSDEDKARIEALGGWDALMETLAKRLQEQKERHEGGNRWIGTGGTSPFGAHGYNPEGIRMAPTDKGQRGAVKVWEKRAFRNLDDRVELGTRNIKLALRGLRQWAREGNETELDLDGTIDATARNSGMLDLRMVPEKANRIKVLLLVDVGGSMSPHVQVCEQLFSAARAEFKHLEHYYFHNCVYDYLWKDNTRRGEVVLTHDVMNRYGSDYKLIFVGDATMSPYEVLQPQGGIEYFNEEPGAVWIERLCAHFRRHAWLIPEPMHYWDQVSTIRIIKELVDHQMFSLTPSGLHEATKALR